MKIAFVHYHLKTGGVTTVLKNQVSALQGRCETLVLTGDRAGTRMACPVVEIPGLGYDRPDMDTVPPEAVAEMVQQAICEVWPEGCDLIHVHNPTLAKNRRFLRIIKRLQQLGVKFFLQIHDFAEDGRPDAYFDESYPADCHYGVINRRDADILIKAGLKAQGLHLLPNAVTPLPVSPGQGKKELILYPVRAIRRKNIGEAILLSLFLENGLRLAITQPPNSPADIYRYREWVDWAKGHPLPVDFAAGQKTDFAVLVGAAQSMITTSIAEGFGFAYLEPWTAGKFVWGRRLKAICRDFEKQGIHLEGLYDRLDVPLAWIDAETFADQWQATVLRAAMTFGFPLDKTGVRTAYDWLTVRGQVDFGILNEPFQRQVLEKVLHDPSCKRTLRSLNPWLAAIGVPSNPAAIITHNRRAVARHYAIHACGERLMEIYRLVVSKPVCHRIDKTALLSAFFDLERFSLLKWNASA
ncbi:glycosyltransferase family 4 protein [Desulfosarcina ovata]|uniref:Glycosyltransferase subfamily 4-like N-terminal domain-containing protein n=1 Tax=Desulfosarcina ovata subsp. ovata TaxID=2752305 RepID=A0A5K8A4A5_9BACT|nr:glycosyltransferase family 4 protein [Desulfosarcina ovata]BBO87372.1 hypothetical protein DSCOOX_05520 [Desulfosarcina ovata subsp. ovata]